MPTGADFSSVNTANLVKTTEGEEGVVSIQLPFLESYAGVLPGITDQPAVTFAFPPSSSSSYTWPQNKEKRLQVRSRQVGWIQCGS